MKQITSGALALLLILSLLLSALPPALAQEAETVKNAALWVRADTGVNTDANGKLTEWADQSGNGHSGTPLNSAKTPVLVQNGIGGKPALQFKDGDQIIDFGQPLPENWDRNAYFVFFVYRPRIVPDGGYHFIGADDWTMFNLHTYSNSGGLYAGFSSTAIGEDANRITELESVGAYQAGQLTVIQFTYQDNKAALYKNGVLLKEKDVTVQPARWDKFRFGIEGAKVGLDGELAELIVYDRRLAQAEQTAITRYLCAKYDENVQTLLKSAWVWLDTEHVEADASGVLVRWPDRTENQNDGIAYAGTAMPSLIPNAAGKLPAVRFETENGEKDALDIPSMMGPMENFSVFFVYNPKTFDGASNHVVRAKGGWKQFIMHTYRQLSGDGSLYAGVSLSGRFNTENAGKAYYEANTWNLLEFRADGKELRLYQNGVLLGTETAASASEVWTGFDMGVVDQMQGDMAELLVFNRALTEEQRRSVSEYLLERYADILPPKLTIRSSNGLLLTRENPTTQLRENGYEQRRTT